MPFPDRHLIADLPTCDTSTSRLGRQYIALDPTDPTDATVGTGSPTTPHVVVCTPSGYAAVPGAPVSNKVETSVDYTTLADDSLVIVDPTPADATITLIDGNDAIQPINVKHDKESTAGKNVLVQGTGGQLIDGETSFEIQLGDSMKAEFSTGRWVIT